MVYLKTLAPTVTAEDSGELIAASFCLGIAHPPGYPLWTMLTHLFTYLPINNIAWRVNFSSALFASAAVAMLFFLLLLLTQNRIAAISVSLGMAYSATFWLQAVITEVYTLNACFVIGLLLILVYWEKYERAEDRYLYLFSFLYGLSLCNHHSMALLGPVYLFYILAVDLKLLVRFKSIGIMFAVFTIGLLPYIYLPIRSLSNPPVDWGNPENLVNFLDHLFRRQYGNLSQVQMRLFSLFIRQTGDYLESLWIQFTPWILWLAIPGLVRLFKDNKRMFLTTVGIFTLSSLGVIFILNFRTEREIFNSVQVFYIPSYIIAVIWIGFGLDGLMRKVRYAYCLFIFLPLLPLFTHYHTNNYSQNYMSYNYGMNILKTVDKEAVVFTSSDYQIFPLTYLQVVEKKRPDVVVCDINADLEKAFLKQGYNEAREIDQAANHKFLLKLLKEGKHPVYYLLKPDIKSIPGYDVFPVGIIYKLVGLSLPESERERLVEFSGQCWQNYNLSGMNDSSVYKDYTTSLIVNCYHLFKGEYYFLLGKKEKAIDEYRLALKYAEDAKQSYNNTANLFAERGLYEEAIPLYLQAIKLDKNYIMAYNNLASVYRNTGRFREAIETWRRSLSIKPDQPMVREELDELGVRLPRPP